MLDVIRRVDEGIPQNRHFANIWWPPPRRASRGDRHLQPAVLAGTLYRTSVKAASCASATRSYHSAGDVRGRCRFLPGTVLGMRRITSGKAQASPKRHPQSSSRGKYGDAYASSSASGLINYAGRPRKLAVMGPEERVNILYARARHRGSRLLFDRNELKKQSTRIALSFLSWDHLALTTASSSSHQNLDNKRDMNHPKKHGNVQKSVFQRNRDGAYRVAAYASLVCMWLLTLNTRCIC
jgi:hypothetical protein